MDFMRESIRAGNVCSISEVEYDYVVSILNESHFHRGAKWTIGSIQGGVSSNVWLAELKGSCNNTAFVIKQPLAKLKVERMWYAPLVRARYEHLWFEMVSSLNKSWVPEVVYYDETKPVIIMKYYSEPHASVWQNDLFQGEINFNFVRNVGKAVAKIHNFSANKEHLRRRFDSSSVLYATRIEPYIISLCEPYPELAEYLMLIGDKVISNRFAVIHGDLSPKNILCHGNEPVFLDAECACYADPAFDIAFCLNHLIMKFFFINDVNYLHLASVLVNEYLVSVNWEKKWGLDRRIAELIPILMLARVDGKSVLNYLNRENKIDIRKMALNLIKQRMFSVDCVLGYIKNN